MDGLIVHYSKGNKAREILYDITYGESKKKTHTHNKCEYNNNNNKKADS